MNRSQKSSRVARSTPSPSETDSIGIRQMQVEVENAIRRRAYELYEKRGKMDGQSEEDWLRAEAELAGKPSEQEVS